MIKILIVDDNANNRLTLKLLLEECPECSIDEASNGKEAVQMCIENSFDLVFMDIMMPIMNGIEATQQIHSFDKEALIVAISAMGDDHNKELILSAGAKDYMTKPINPDLFLHRLNNYRILIRSRKNCCKFIWPNTNLFEFEIYSHASIFYLRNESDISEAWEYLMSLDTFSGQIASDAIQTYFNIALFLLEKGDKSQLLLEENETYYILTVLATETWNEQKITKDISKNFTGEYKVSHNSFSLLIPKNEKVKFFASAKIGLDDITLNVLRHSHIQKIPAITYINELTIESTDKLDNLESIEESIDVAIDVMQRDSKNSSWLRLGNALAEYATVIESLLEFHHLSFAIGTLVKFIDGTVTNEMDLKKRSKLLIILKSILDDLSQWRHSIFITADSIDIHYLDSSLLSSCLQAQMLFEEPFMEVDNDMDLF
jgi:CheY-like chemotaxis protein